MKKENQDPKHSNQSPDRDRDRRDERDKDLSPDIDFPTSGGGSGQVPVGD